MIFRLKLYFIFSLQSTLPQLLSRITYWLYIQNNVEKKSTIQYSMKENKNSLVLSSRFIYRSYRNHLHSQKLRYVVGTLSLASTSYRETSISHCHFINFMDFSNHLIHQKLPTLQYYIQHFFIN